MKNYYKILEVSETASFEVIEKAYKTLAKKYHPDMQIGSQVYWAENKFKEITEAYEVLSNKELRNEYDFRIGTGNNLSIQYDNLYYENENLKKEVNNLKFENESRKYTNKIKKENTIRSTLNPKRYFKLIATALYNETKKDPAERSKDLKALILTAIIVSIIVILFWKIPFLNKLLFP